MPQHLNKVKRNWTPTLQNAKYKIDLSQSKSKLPLRNLMEQTKAKMKPQVKFKKSKKTSPKDVWRYKQVEAMWKTERKIPIDPKLIINLVKMSGLQLSVYRAPTMTRARLIEKARVEMMAKNIRSDVDALDVRVVEDLVGDGDLDWSDILERGRLHAKKSEESGEYVRRRKSAEVVWRFPGLESEFVF